MTTAPVWIGSRPKVICHAFKKGLVLQPWQIAQRIEFRFETVWCVREGEKLVLSDKSTIPITVVYANGKALIGLNDPYQTGLDYNEDARAFRNALDERAKERSGQIV